MSRPGLPAEAGSKDVSQAPAAQPAIHTAVVGLAPSGAGVATAAAMESTSDIDEAPEPRPTISPIFNLDVIPVERSEECAVEALKLISHVRKAGERRLDDDEEGRRLKVKAELAKRFDEDPALQSHFQELLRVLVQNGSVSRLAPKVLPGSIVANYVTADDPQKREIEINNDFVRVCSDPDYRGALTSPHLTESLLLTLVHEATHGLDNIQLGGFLKAVATDSPPAQYLDAQPSFATMKTGIKLSETKALDATGIALRLVDPRLKIKITSRVQDGDTKGLLDQIRKIVGINPEQYKNMDLIREIVPRIYEDILASKILGSPYGALERLASPEYNDPTKYDTARKVIVGVVEHFSGILQDNIRGHGVVPLDHMAKCLDEFVGRFKARAASAAPSSAPAPAASAALLGAASADKSLAG